MTTYSAKLKDIERSWYVVDATDIVLGRLSAEVAKILRGKHKPIYSGNIDCGDNVIVINADKVCLKGNKLTDKKYYKHTGYPGGIKETNPQKLISDGKGKRIVESAIKRMIPRSPIGNKQFSKLHVYSGESHPHEAQKPTELKIAEQNTKNNKLRTYNK